MKITNEIKDKIKEMKTKGIFLRDIAKELNISKSTVDYWYNDEMRIKHSKKCVEKFRNLPIEKKKEIYASRKGYIRKYFNKRYHIDELFREKHKERTRANYHKKSALKGGIN